MKRVKEITGGEGAHAALDAVGAESTGQVHALDSRVCCRV